MSEVNGRFELQADLKDDPVLYSQRILFELFPLKYKEISLKADVLSFIW